MSPQQAGERDARDEPTVAADGDPAPYPPTSSCALGSSMPPTSAGR